MQVKKHPFFGSLDWESLKERKIGAPFTPKLTGDATDAKYFDPSVTELPIQRHFAKKGNNVDVNIDFPGFKHEQRGSVSQTLGAPIKEYLNFR